MLEEYRIPKSVSSAECLQARTQSVYGILSWQEQIVLEFFPDPIKVYIYFPWPKIS